MPIRIKNLDLKSDGMKRNCQVVIGDVTATKSYFLFVAPVACVVNSVSIVSSEANPPATTTASTTHMSATLVAIINGTNSTMTARGTSATKTTTNSVSANSPWVLTPSANNSLTNGTPVLLTVTVGGSGNLSAVLASVIYTPQIHRETK